MTTASDPPQMSVDKQTLFSLWDSLIKTARAGAARLWVSKTLLVRSHTAYEHIYPRTRAFETLSMIIP